MGRVIFMAAGSIGGLVCLSEPVICFEALAWHGSWPCKESRDANLLQDMHKMRAMARRNAIATGSQTFFSAGNSWNYGVIFIREVSFCEKAR